MTYNYFSVTEANGNFQIVFIHQAIRIYPGSQEDTVIVLKDNNLIYAKHPIREVLDKIDSANS